MNCREAGKRKSQTSWLNYQDAKVIQDRLQGILWSSQIAIESKRHQAISL
jgi:hypothetical protein